MRVLFLVVLISFFAPVTQAKKLELIPRWDRWSDTSALRTDTVQTKESVVEMNGHKYRKLEVDGHDYFLKFLESGESASNEDVLCGAPERNQIKPKLIEAGVVVAHRTKVFIEGLSKMCKDNEAGNHSELNPTDINIGVAIEGKEAGHRKKLFINPLTLSPGISSEW